MQDSEALDMESHWSDPMIEIDQTHAIDLKSWFEPANRATTDFPIQNLPFGMYRMVGSNDSFRACTAIGDHVLDLAAVDAEYKDNLNKLAGAGRTTWRQLRVALSQALSAVEMRSRIERFLVPMAKVELGLPVLSRDFTDFFTSYFHAYNAGKLFRPDDPLTPNFKWMPIAYHGRASSIIVSGTEVRRPWGQIITPDSANPIFAPSRFLDFETELGFVVGPSTELGLSVNIDQAEDHLFGVVLLNDWSARDIQAWEYQPLGPFLAKSFASTISPWIVTLEALVPFRAPAFKRFEGDPAPLAYLTSSKNNRSGHFSINLAAHLKPRGGSLQCLSKANYDTSYWNPAQLVAHQTSNGCPLNAGDLLGTGTISGPAASEAGALLELGKMGQTPVILENGSTRIALEDGDQLILKGGCVREGYRSIGFGEAAGIVTPAQQL